MAIKKRFLIIGAILIAVAVFTVFLSRSKDKVIWQPESQQVEQVQQLNTDWVIFRNGYSLPVPPGWKNTSDKGGRAVLVPGESEESRIGSISEISVTVVSDANSPKGQQFTTQKEFDDWLKVEGEVQGPVQKLDNIRLDNTEGIELLVIHDRDNSWNIIVWSRKEGSNLYINFKGNKEYSTEDAEAIDYIVSNFKFN